MFARIRSLAIVVAPAYCTSIDLTIGACEAGAGCCARAVSPVPMKITARADKRMRKFIEERDLKIPRESIPGGKPGYKTDSPLRRQAAS